MVLVLLSNLAGCDLFAVPPDDTPPEPTDTGSAPGPLNPYDQDGDGYMPLEAAQPFLRDFGNTPPFFVPEVDAFGDCLDVADDTVRDRDGNVVDPATVNPAATEIFYDGIDSDCAGDNDFDADQDGYMPDEAANANAYEAYLEAWNYGERTAKWLVLALDPNLTEPAFGDCNDDVPTAWPGAAEGVGDGVDEDCDGRIDISPFGATGANGLAYAWTAPRAIEAGRVRDHYLLLVTADAAELEASLVDVSTTLAFPAHAARGPAEPTAAHLDFDGAGHAGTTIDAEADSGFTYVVSYDQGTLLVSELTEDDDGVMRSVLRSFPSPGQPLDNVILDFALDPSASIGSAMACDPNGRIEHGIFNTLSGLTSTAEVDTGGTLTGCYFTDVPRQLNSLWRVTLDACTASACLEWWATEDNPLLTGPFAPNQPLVRTADFDDGFPLRVFADGDGDFIRTNGLSVDVLPTASVTRGPMLDADLTEHQGTFYIGALARLSESDNQVVPWLQVGTPGDWAYQALEFDVPGFEDATLTYVTLHADDEGVLLGVIGQGPDIVAWSFYATR